MAEWKQLQIFCNGHQTSNLRTRPVTIVSEQKPFCTAHFEKTQPWFHSPCHLSICVLPFLFESWTYLCLKIVQDWSDNLDFADQPLTQGPLEFPPAQLLIDFATLITRTDPVSSFAPNFVNFTCYEALKSQVQCSGADSQWGQMIVEQVLISRHYSLSIWRKTKCTWKSDEGVMKSLFSLSIWSNIWDSRNKSGSQARCLVNAECQKYLMQKMSLYV